MKAINKTGYIKIIKHYEDKINTHGLTTRGLDWKSKKDNDKRFLKIYQHIKFYYKGKISIFYLSFNY